MGCRITRTVSTFRSEPIVPNRAAIVSVFSIGTAFVAAGCIPPAGSPIPFVRWSRHTIDAASRGADGVRLIDVNGDDLPDIATGWEEGGRIRICINPGPNRARQKWPAVTVGEVGAPEDAVFADLDGDGAIDVVSSCEGGVRTMYVHWAPGDRARYLDAPAWQTEAIPTSENAMKWMFCLPMQVDDARGIDLVAGAKGGGAKIGWFEAPAEARDLTAWEWHPLLDAGWIMSLIATDMDGDGDDDVLVSDRRGKGRGCLWLENPDTAAAKHRPWPVHRIGGEDHEVMFLTQGDLDQDGLDDVVVATKDNGLLFFRRLSANGHRWRRHTIAMPENTGTGKAVAIGDVDRDGRRDLVVTCEHAGDGKSGVFWLRYVTAPTDPVWVRYEISGPEGIKYDLAELIDLDADGDLDVLTCEERANLGVIWYENPLGPR